MQTSHLEKLLESTGLEITAEEENFVGWSSGTRDSMVISSCAVYTTRAFRHSLQSHAEAMQEAAEVVSQHSEGLKRATWSLVAVTAVLAFATLALVIVSV